MEETIDLNDYKEFINIEYLKSLKLQKETIKPSIKNSKYFLLHNCSINLLYSKTFNF